MSDKTTTCLGIILGVLIVAVVGGIMNGWALSTVWNWFIPPIFHLTTLTLAQAIGVSTVFTLFTGTKTSTSNTSSKDKSFGEVVLESLITAILAPVFTVIFAWIILQLAF